MLRSLRRRWASVVPRLPLGFYRLRRRSVGERGERLAAKYLIRQGMRIVGRQVHIAGGELDLVAVDGRTVVFVEVKTRRSVRAGHPLEAVTPEKQRRLTRLGLAYLRRNHLLENAARFDVVAILWPNAGGPQERRPEIIHVRSAFEPAGRGQMFA